jgi:hypothetical protein
VRIFWNRCSKFSYIINAKSEDEMSSSELEFVASHSSDCDRCTRYLGTNLGINLLQSCQIEPTVSSGFDERVIRLSRVLTKKTSLAYWSPAFAGAAIAGLAVLAVIQLVSKPHQLPVFRATGEARRVQSPMFPTTGVPDRSLRGQ